MKTLLAIAASLIAVAGVSQAGRPIILSESDACAHAELVVLATIGQPKETPKDEPFGGSKWDEFGFTRFAESKITKTLIGKRPKKLRVYGGKFPAGTDYRLESGDFLVLLSKVGDDAYRAVDWHYSFMPIKDGKVSWLVDRFSKKREWISVAEATRRITVHQVKGEPTKSEQGGAHQPTTAPDSKSEGNEKPKPESEVRSQ